MKSKAIIIKRWMVYGYQGRFAGWRCLIECQWCGKGKELTVSRVRKGGGIFCSIKCRQKSQSKLRRGVNHSNWKGGRRKCKRTGYILVRRGDKYIREHRLIMEKVLGRKLRSYEFVHHRNGIKDDNSFVNLEIVLNKTHKGKVNCPYCLEEFAIR